MHEIESEKIVTKLLSFMIVWVRWAKKLIYLKVIFKLLLSLNKLFLLLSLLRKFNYELCESLQNYTFFQISTASTCFFVFFFKGFLKKVFQKRKKGQRKGLIKMPKHWIMKR